MAKQVNFYEEKLKHKTDSWDLFEKIIVPEGISEFDARSKDMFEQEHIPGAVNLPHRTMNEQGTSHFNKKILYVT